MENPISFDFLCECFQRVNSNRNSVKPPIQEFLSEVSKIKNLGVLEISNEGTPSDWNELEVDMIPFQGVSEKTPIAQILYYNGSVDHSSIKKILSDSLSKLNNTFVLLVKHWNLPTVRSGILTSILEHKLSILNDIPIRTTTDNSFFFSDEKSWDNGFYIGVLQKS
jgi:hypothetical protein